MNSPAITRVAIPPGSYDLDAAREFVCAVINSMRLNRAEKLALVHSAKFFHTNRDLRGIVHSRSGYVHYMPRPLLNRIRWSPEAIVNTTLRAALWLSALRGKSAKRGSKVLTYLNGRPVFGRVTRVNVGVDGERGLRVKLDEGQHGVGRFYGGIYNGDTICNVDEDDLAVLAC